MANLREKYNKELRVALQEKLGLKNIMAVPKLTKVVINMGVAGSFSQDYIVGDVVEVVEDNFSELGFENGNDFEQFSDFVIKYNVKAKTNLKKVKGITVNTVHGNEHSIDEIVNIVEREICL